MCTAILDKFVHIHEPVGRALVGEVSSHGHHDIVVVIVLRLSLYLGYEVVYLEAKNSVKNSFIPYLL